MIALLTVVASMMDGFFMIARYSRLAVFSFWLLVLQSGYGMTRHGYMNTLGVYLLHGLM